MKLKPNAHLIGALYGKDKENSGEEMFEKLIAQLEPMKIRLTNESNTLYSKNDEHKEIRPHIQF